MALEQPELTAQTPAPGWWGGRDRQNLRYWETNFGFLAFLAMKIAFTDHAGQADAAQVAHDAYAGFLRDHVRAWFDEFCEAFTATGSVQASTIAELLGAVAA